MKILIFSDTHLTAKFDQKKFEFLVKIIKTSDKVVINGDFIDDWYVSLEDFINSEWKQLFPLLLSKKTTYIAGNHDSALGAQVDKFCTEYTEFCDLRVGETTYHIEHGNNLLPQTSNPALKYYIGLIESRNRIVLNVLKYLQRFWYYFTPELMIKSNFAHSRNVLIASNKNPVNWLLVGDTHYAEINSKNKYANSGAIMYGYASYLIVTENGVELFETRY